MAPDVQPGIIVRVLRKSGGLFDVCELMPLLAPVGIVLTDIREKGGPAIDPRSIRSSQQEFPVLWLQGVRVSCVIASERTDDEEETRWLRAERERGLRQAFQDLARADWRSVDRLASSPALAHAAFVLTAILETAMVVVRMGEVTREIGDVTLVGSVASAPPTGPAEVPVLASRRDSGRILH